MPPTTLVPVAEYLRMSTEHQQYSLHNQAEIIRRYATQHGYKVVRSYSDPARSGLMLKNREGLARLLKDVVSEGVRLYKAILVYDVSRWGRFQDTDEAAHYEFLCKSAGIPIHYCAETFVNDTTMPSIVMKTLKRVMAAEYSRELSEKVFAGAKNISLLGYRLGGVAGYGLRRMLCWPDGTPRTIMREGERKSLLTDRITLVPGPADEVECVREIFRLVVEERKTYRQIADILNRRGVSYVAGRQWQVSSVLGIIQNPKYSGCYVWGRRSKKLGGRSLRVPEELWTKIPHKFEPIVDECTFDRAQAAMRRSLGNQELLACLRKLLREEGRVSERMLNYRRDTPCATVYHKRFGSLRRAFDLVGYKPQRIGWDKARFGRLRTLRNNLAQELAKRFPEELLLIQQYPYNRPHLQFRSGPLICIIVCPSMRTISGALRWQLPVRRPTTMTLLCRCDEANANFYDFHLLPRMDPGRAQLKSDDPYIRRGKKITNLSQLKRIAQAMHRNRTAKGEKH